MVGRILLGFAVVAALAIAAVMALTRRSADDIHDGAVQWPFDTDELRSLMNRVVDEQHERIASIDDPDGRQRAQAFLEYYEGRRSAATT